MTEDLDAWLREWGVADPEEHRGGLRPEGPRPDGPVRQVTLLQRKSEKLGRRLGKTTGWIHRAGLQMKNVRMVGGVNYERIDTEGLHVSYGEGRERPELIAADTIVLCAGQEPSRGLADTLAAAGIAWPRPFRRWPRSWKAWCWNPHCPVCRCPRRHPASRTPGTAGQRPRAHAR